MAALPDERPGILTRPGFEAIADMVDMAVEAKFEEHLSPPRRGVLIAGGLSVEEALAREPERRT